MLEFQAEISLVTQLEVQSLTCKLWLRRIQFIRLRDNLRYKDFQDFEHAILSAQEIIKEYRSFIHKRSHFDREKLATDLHYQDRLKSSLAKALKEKEKSKFEMLEDDDRMSCRTYLICTTFERRWQQSMRHPYLCISK